jgi:Transposase DDE domain
VPAIPSWLLEPLWDQFAALLPDRPVYHPSHPLGCHKPRIADRVIFEKLIQVLRFGCSYVSIADCACVATTIRERGDEWIRAGIFADLKTIARESYDRIVGLALRDIAVDGCITKAPGGGDCAGPSPVDRRKQGMKRSLMVEGRGIPLGRVLAPANRHDSPLLAPTLDKLDDLGPLPDDITVHLDAGYDSQKTRDELAGRGMTGEIAHKGDKARSRPGSAGTWSGPTPGTTASTGSSAATTARRNHRRVLRPRRRDHHGPQAHPRGMDPLPVGWPPGQASMTTHLSARALSRSSWSAGVIRTV